MTDKLKIRKGFTIIEVLIVLAIAGVILLIVFLAVPALQRNSRNTQRNNDASLVAAAVSECMANHNATVTSCDAVSATEVQLDTARLAQLTATPSFSTVTATAPAPAASTTQSTVWFQKKCLTDGSGVDTVNAGTSKQFAVSFLLEGTGTNTVTRCIDA